jgi:excisionase family DNA binding protein
MPSAPTPTLESLSAQVAALTAAVTELAARVPQQLVTVEEAARRVGCSVKTVRRRIASREWPCVRVGRAVRLDLAAILEASRAADPNADLADRLRHSSQIRNTHQKRT